MRRPEVFSPLELDDARALAQRRQKWLLISLVSGRAADCMAMNENTWCDASVLVWVRHHAVAVQFDVEVDVEASRFGVRQVPAVLVFQGANELGRSSGAKTPQQLLSWLEGLLLVQGALEPPHPQQGKSEVMARVELVQVLLVRGDVSRAVEETLWLWRNCLRLDPDFGPLKHAMLQVWMMELCIRSPSAHSAFAAERDATLLALEKQFEPEIALDLFTLCNALGEEASAWSWFEREQARLPRDFVTWNQVSMLLSAAGQWAVLGRFVGDPLAILEESHQGLALAVRPFPGQTQELFDRGRAMMLAAFQAGAATLVRALRAAGRVEEAMAVHTRALQLDDSRAMRAGLGATVAEA